MVSVAIRNPLLNLGCVLMLQLSSELTGDGDVEKLSLRQRGWHGHAKAERRESAAGKLEIPPSNQGCGLERSAETLMYARWSCSFIIIA
jgi:hypothetical protein